MNPIEFIPDWAVTDEAKVFAFGFAFAMLVRLTRSIIRHVRRAGTERID